MLATKFQVPSNTKIKNPERVFLVFDVDEKWL